jgi:peroxiredoxin
MRKVLISLTAVLAMALVTAFAFAGDKHGDKKASDGLHPGTVVPNFAGTDQNGKLVELNELKGKLVVLEWFNNECPFVVKHYKTGAMNELASRYADKGVVWVLVNSTAGKSEADMQTVAKDWNITRPILLDKDGTLGKTFGARNTPTMYVIDKEGKLAYRGAIDNKPDSETASIAGAKNYVAQALDELLAGQSVSEPETKAYGCGVKYGK